MSCEDVRAALPEYAGEPDPYPHDLEVHLATCAACAAEERIYREALEHVAALRFETQPVPTGFSERVFLRLSRPDRVRGAARRVAHHPRARYAAASLGGVVVGAAAYALLKRVGRRRAAA